MQRIHRHAHAWCSVLRRIGAAGAGLALLGSLLAWPSMAQARPAAKKPEPAVAVAGADDANDPRPALLIGFAGPLSGTAAGVGRSMQNAVQLAVIEANQKGVRVGNTTYRLKLLTQDDRADPGTAEFVARYLASQHVVGVVGHWNSGASLAAAPVYHAAGIVQISPATLSRKFTALGYPGVFRTIANNEGAGRNAAEYVVNKLGMKTVGTIDDRTPFGHGLAEEFARTARELGAEVVGSYSVSDKTSDFNGPLLQLRKRQPELIFFGGLDWQAALVARSIKRLKLSARLMGAAGTVGLPFLMSAGADGNGTLVLEPGLPTEKMPGWKAFRLRYGGHFDTNVDLYAVFAYDAATVLVQAIRQADSIEMPAIVQALRKIRANGIGGPIAFNEEGDLLNPAFTMYEVQERRWVPVQQMSSSPPLR